MATHRNDNTDPFEPLSRANERIVDQLDEKQKSRTDEEERAEARRQYVKQWVQKTLMWERRISQPKK